MVGFSRCHGNKEYMIIFSLVHEIRENLCFDVQSCIVVTCAQISTVQMVSFMRCVFPKNNREKPFHPKSSRFSFLKELFYKDTCSSQQNFEAEELKTTSKLLRQFLWCFEIDLCYKIIVVVLLQTVTHFLSGNCQHSLGI